MNNNIEDKRFQFLKKLYDVSDANEESVSVNPLELGAELGLSSSEIDRISDFLNSEELIGIYIAGSIYLKHKGIVEVEKAMSQPNEPTAYFPAINYIHVEQMIGSQIQQSANKSSQVLTYSAIDFEAMRKLVSDLKNQLSELKLNAETQAEVESDIATIETQIKSPHPKHTIIKESLMSLRTILEGAAGSVIAALLMQQIAVLLK